MEIMLVSINANLWLKVFPEYWTEEYTNDGETFYEEDFVGFDVTGEELLELFDGKKACELFISSDEDEPTSFVSISWYEPNFRRDRTYGIRCQLSNNSFEIRKEE